MKLSKRSIASILDKIMIYGPMVHYMSDITNASDFAGVVKTFNGKSIMSYGIEEIHEITAASDLLLVGFETLDNGKILAMERALRVAKKRNVPVFFDLSGVDLSLYRRNTALSFLNRFTVDVVKGNEKEVQALIKSQKRSRCKEKDIKSEYRDFALRNKVFLLIEAEKYYITDGYSEFYIDNNEEWLKKIIELNYIFTALLSVAISVADNKNEKMAAILIAIMAFSICCNLQIDNLKEYNNERYIDVKGDFLYNIKNIKADEIYLLGNILYDFKSRDEKI